MIFSPFSLAVTAMLQTAAVLSRPNKVKSSKRIIDSAPDFVHAVIRIGLLDFQKGTHETTANERPEGL